MVRAGCGWQIFEASAERDRLSGGLCPQGGLSRLRSRIANKKGENDVTGTEKEKLEVGTGEYNKMIDKRIAEIKETCGVK